MFGGDFLTIYIIAYSRTEATLVAEAAKEMIEQGGDGGLAVGSGNAYEFQALCGITIEGCGYFSYGIFCIGYTYKCNISRHLCRHGIAEQNSCGSLLYRSVDISMSICLCAFDSHKQISFYHFAGVDIYSCNFYIHTAAYFEQAHIF